MVLVAVNYFVNSTANKGENALFVALFFFLIGIVLVVKGGDIFVDAALWVAGATRIPKFIIGATVVSLATTLPELLVSVFAAARGSADMAVGNAVGSVTCNAGMILAISIIVSPITIRRREIMGKGLLMVAAAYFLWSFSLDGALTAKDGVLMLLVLGIFVFLNIHCTKHMARTGQTVVVNHRHCITNTAKFILGTAGIVLGAQMLVEHGSALARLAGISEGIIGITMLAIGTSLPELVTTVSAVAKKEFSLSVGNIIGANIIDLCLILPLCSLFSKSGIAVSGPALAFDFPVLLTILLLAIIPPVLTKRFYRFQGILMLLVYVGYLFLRI